jgi:hypothetical protein
MSIAALYPDEGPLARSGYLIVEFDPRNAHLALVSNVVYDESAFDDAVADAQEMTERSSEQRLPLIYTVVHIDRRAAFRPI